VSDLNMQLVREFFELRLFHVLTHWQHEGLLPRTADTTSLLFVEHTSPEAGRAPDFVLAAEEVPRIHRAVVEVRAWHADRFYPSVIENSSALSHIADSETRQLAQAVFGNDDFTSILVLSELPASHDPRARAVQLLRDRGIGHIIEFPTLLRDMVERVSAHGNYAPSQSLQTMRILKRYNLIRRQQLEFAFATEAPVLTTAPSVHVQTEAPEQDDEAE